MLKNILHKIVAIPGIYDRLQYAIGLRFRHPRVQKQLRSSAPDSLILDLGGGTGLNKVLLPSVPGYICLDYDGVKLSGYRDKYPDGRAIHADASRIPLESASVDVALCTSVAHHLTDELLTSLLDEVMRILKPTGRLIFLDPVWDTDRFSGQLLWKYDRGDHPRTPETLRAVLSDHGQITYWENFTGYHSYIISVVVPNDT